MSRNVNTTGKPKLFSPSVLREETKYAPPFQVKLSSLSDTNFESTSSFRYDDPGTGVKSTQEIPLDWSRFENHTFFNSAQSKVNVAFDRIINEYPFDGNQKELEAFEDSLTGYENYIYQQFPKSRGFLLLSGTSTTENPEGGHDAELGTYIKVFDSAGSQFPDFSRKNNGEAIIDFGFNPFSFEFFFRPPRIDNSTSIIFQKRDTQERAVSLFLSGTTDTRKTDVIFSVISGSAKLITSASIEKGAFSHICATYDRGVSNKLQLYVSESLVSTSSRSFEFDSLSFGRPILNIGSGSTVTIPTYMKLGSTIEPLTTLSGAIDEFRVFHSTRTEEEQKAKGRKDIYASDNLKLYFKFNEPYGSFNIENVVLDSSGNSLHSRISNFTSGLRNTGSYSNPMTDENVARCPILFPSYTEVGNLNTKLLNSASFYDDENPNLITKLLPVHYLLEGQSAQGLQDQEGQIASPITANSIPGSARIGSAQYLTAFLLIWAKFFDEIKIFVDHFVDVTHPSYDDTETVASKFLPFVARYYGINLPAIFPDTDPTQFIEGEDIKDNYSRSLKSLSYVQSEIWKRILINLNEIIRSKGTVHSVTSLIRAVGINPNSMMVIREFGGPTKRSLTGLRRTNTEVANSIEFSGSLGRSVGSLTSFQGFNSKKPHIISEYLSASRVEVGFPYPDPFVQATGTVTVSDYSTITDGLILNVTDSAGKALAFEFDSGGAISSAGDVPIPISSVSNDDQATIIMQKITGSFSGSIAAAMHGNEGELSLSQAATQRKNLGNHTLDGTISSVGVSLSGFSGGTGFISQNSKKYGMHGVSTVKSDGLLTSGSFTYEAIYQFQKTIKTHFEEQSLVRLHVTGTAEPSNTHGVLANLMVISGTQSSLSSSGSTLKLFVNNGRATGTAIKTLELALTGVNIFDGNLWNVSFGRERSDQKKVTAANYYLAKPISTAGSASYFLRCARQAYGEIKQLFTTSAFYKEPAGPSGTGTNNMFQYTNATQNASGAFIVVGSQTIQGTGADRYLNSTSKSPDEARVTNFDGQVSQIRFWSTALEQNDWLEHVRNFKSIGVKDPMVNFNFDTAPTGAFGRLRMDLSIDQEITASRSRYNKSFRSTTGEIILTDFSQNSIYATGSGFEPDNVVVVPETFYYSALSPKFDMSQTDNKIRIRSYETSRLIDEHPYATSAPSYEVLRSEEPNDDTRFAIEFSSVRALDDDIMNIFGTLEFFNNALGKPNLIFDDFYPDMDQMRKIYFQRLTGNPDYQVFFNMYKWFNSTLGSLVEQLIPRKTKFLGINFVIESHVLERNRFRYLFDEIYLSALDRDTTRGTLLLSQIVGTMRKF